MWKAFWKSWKTTTLGAIGAGIYYYLSSQKWQNAVLAGLGFAITAVMKDFDVTGGVQPTQ